MTAQLQPGKLVTLRGREWVVLPSDDPDNLLIIKPLGGSDDETTGIYLPLDIDADRPVDARFSPPISADLGDISTARLLYDSARLAFRNGAGPFRALAKLSFRPRAYQIVPLIMALRQDTVRLLIADDVGVGKTIEALLIVRELLERRAIKRFAVVCLPHLCEQWQEEIRSKLDIEAVIIRSNTQARLDRQIQGDASVYDYYPFQIISIDFIKSDVRRDVFVEQCPELVIVDETHTCARPTGASAAQQQRYHLISRIAAKPGQHVVMLTATPHSGKPEEFQSLLGLLKPEFEPLDLPGSSQAQRRDLARHFIQRKRADVEKWMDEETPFPVRDAFEWPYDLSREYADFFGDIIDFARKLVIPDPIGKRKKRVQYWTALALLRGVMSSPEAGVKMLNTRLDRLPEGILESDPSAIVDVEIENPIRDLDYGFEGDNAPTQVLEQCDWTEHQRRQLKTFAERLEKLGTIQYDGKLFAAAIVLEEWLEKGFNTVVFCRYIETAKYLGIHLGPALRKKHPKLDLQVVTSEDPDDVRRQHIAEMSGDKLRVLIATDCLSEGINLQELFTAVLHYDLPWNPNRLEQREGRVDRFGQQATEVKACLLYGADNPIDGIVLDVLLRKVREIKRATGINVPFPEDSQSIIDTITQALLLNPDRRIEKKRAEDQQLFFDFTEFSEAAAAKAKVTRKVDEAAKRETASRSIFAQHAIKAHEIEEDLRAVDEAIGDPKAVREFVTATLPNLLGVQVTKERHGFGIVPGNLPPQLVDLLPTGKLIKISFESPTPEGYHYLGRNHRFVEQLCQFVMANTLARQDKRAARTAVIRTSQVARKTTLLLFRCRNVIEQSVAEKSRGKHQIVAEEMLLWGWRGSPGEKEFLDHAEAKDLLTVARASSDLSSQARASFLDNELRLMDSLATQFEVIAEEQSKRLVAAHERFSALMDKQRFQVVYPILPMDLLGIYILLPGGGRLNYPSIRIEGAILSPDVLDRIDDLPGQKPADFGLDSSIKVKDEIARAWADAQDYWRIFQRKLESLKPDSPATSETRQQWVVPLLALLGYQIDHHARAAELNGKLYAISHRATNRALAPVQIVGYREPAGLDRKPENATLRMSAHAVVQEFINLNEQLYGLVTNGRILRLLRDSSRLIKLSYLEFDLDRIFTDGLFSDFAVLYRLLHATRLPLTNETAAESLIERYHQDSLDSGARIREGLSKAVERAIRDFGTGFLKNAANAELREAIANGTLRPVDYYKNLLRLIYRLLFLMVIEERDLVFPPGATKKHRDIYRDYYSVRRLRILSERRYLADPRRHDLWLALMSTFRLFEADGPGNKLGLAPLAGDLFGYGAIPHLANCTLGNDVLLGCLRSLSVYEHPENKQLIRVNYGALNVEEFGSVYEGLLEYKPVFKNHGNGVEFDFAMGGERAATGSHYTPDDLVQPLIKHSLDYLIADRRNGPNPETALLDLRVADIACGSGHILLAAARRIATELAIVRTGEEQPSPPAFRSALRDVIRTCIYGVDLNPLAVELCKVALWLEAHNPGQPLNFLDHHIKCGNAIVGFVQREELDKGVPNEAFATLPGDDKDLAAKWRIANKQDRADIRQMRLAPAMQQRLDGRLAHWNVLSALPERTPAEIEAKKEQFLAFAQGNEAFLLSQIAAIPIAQFYVAKEPGNDSRLVADAQFRRFWTDGQIPQGEGTAMALATSIEKRFFHWFLEFPDIVARGGFDCILGNPPYLGRGGIRSTYGNAFCGYVQWEFMPAGISDLVVFFVRRIFRLLKKGGFTAFITTNSIKDGEIRKDGLDQVIAQGGEINMAVRAIRWPGRANLFVSLVALHSGAWKGRHSLDGLDVEMINSFFEDSGTNVEPTALQENSDRVTQGSIFLGDGFLLNDLEVEQLIANDARNEEVISQVTNGQEINSLPDQKPGRRIVNFRDWTMERASGYAAPFARIELMVKPERVRAGAPEKWWQFWRPRSELYGVIGSLKRCFVAARTTKYLNFSAAPVNYVFTDALYVFATDRWDLFAVVQSTIHEVWARKYSGALKQDLRYSPSKCFDTFAFPEGLWQTANPTLATLGEGYHEYRKSLMRALWLGLTDVYNLFHSRDLTPTKVAKVSKKSPEESARGYEGLLELRRLQVQLDLAIRDAYSWQSLPLDHDFYEVETLAESDRLRYTISPAARKELLRRFLALNHVRAEDEKAAPKPTKPNRRKRVPTPDAEYIEMFTENADVPSN